MRGSRIEILAGMNCRIASSSNRVLSPPGHQQAHTPSAPTIALLHTRGAERTKRQNRTRQKNQTHVHIY